MSDATEPKPEPKTEPGREVAVHKPAPLLAGAELAPFMPRSLEEAFRLATAIAKTNTAPKTLDSAEKCMIAILSGAEIGLPPMQSIQSYYVVNNRFTLWGDALPALLWPRGFKLEEWFDNDSDAYPNDMAAVCCVTRPDGQEITRSFSVHEAKEAKLWSKQGPWEGYKRRMLQMRARAFAVRDGAADVLRGTAIAEEVQDYDVGTIPSSAGREESGLAARLAGGTNGSSPSSGDEASGQHTSSDDNPDEVSSKLATELVTAVRHADSPTSLAELVKEREGDIDSLQAEDKAWVEETARLKLDEFRAAAGADIQDAEIDEEVDERPTNDAQPVEEGKTTPDSAADASEASAEETSGQPAASEPTATGLHAEDEFPGDKPASEGQPAEEVDQETGEVTQVADPIFAGIMKAKEWDPIAALLLEHITSGAFDKADKDAQDRLLMLAYNSAMTGKWKVNPEHDPMFFLAWSRLPAPGPELRKAFRALTRTRAFQDLPDAVADLVADARDAASPDE